MFKVYDKRNRNKGTKWIKNMHFHDLTFQDSWNNFLNFAYHMPSNIPLCISTLKLCCVLFQHDNNNKKIIIKINSTPTFHTDIARLKFLSILHVLGFFLFFSISFLRFFSRTDCKPEFPWSSMEVWPWAVWRQIGIAWRQDTYHPGTRRLFHLTPPVAKATVSVGTITMAAPSQGEQLS